jgi:hypothetical protein
LDAGHVGLVLLLQAFDLLLLQGDNFLIVAHAPIAFECEVGLVIGQIAVPSLIAMALNSGTSCT